MCFGSFFSGLQFKNNFVIHKNVRKILTNCLAFIENLDRNLLLDRMSAFGQFLGKGIFIYFLKKPIPERVVNMIEGIDDVRCYLFMKHISTFLG